MAKYTFNDTYDLDEIFAYTDTNDERLSLLFDKSIIRYRCKTVKSGDILESEIYPIWNTHKSMSRARKAKESRETQKTLNIKNAVKNIIRLVNTNFTESDIWGTFTYETAKLPKTVEGAQNEFAKYIRRLRYYATTHNFPPLKYVYTTEFEDNPNKGKHRVHHHIVLNFPDRDVAEKLWRNGARTQTRRLQADEDGYEGLVRYITKDPCGTKRYVTSKNLQKPQVTVADCKFTRKKVNDLAMGKTDPYRVFESMYKNYKLTRTPKPKTSDYVMGVYIYAKMIKTKIKGGRKSEVHRE